MSYGQPRNGQHGYPQQGHYGSPQQGQYGQPPYPQVQVPSNAYGYAPGYGPGPTAPLGPRVHPSENTAFIFGLCALAVGPITGIPAIWLGRKILREAEASPHMYRATFASKAGIGLGWIGCSMAALTVFIGLGSSSTAAAVLLIVGGIASAAFATTGAFKDFSPPVDRVSAVLRRYGAAWVLMGTAVLGGFTSVAARAAQADKAARECASNQSRAAAALAQNDFSTAHKALDGAKSVCPANRAADISMAQRNVDARQVAFEKATDEAAAAQAAAESAAREAAALDAFPAIATEVKGNLRSALNKAGRSQWEASDSSLNSARAALNRVAGTSVVTTKDYTDLDTEVTAIHQKIQPQLDRIAQKKAADDARAAAKEEREQAAAALVDDLRGPMPVNSAWDGSVRAVETSIKERMNDPDSYEHVRTTIPFAQGMHWVVTSTYRGKNAFGAKIVVTHTFWIQQGEVVKSDE